MGNVCLKGPGECQACKEGWYLKKEDLVDDECIEGKDIASVDPPHGIDTSAAIPEIKQCVIDVCFGCWQDYTKCDCTLGSFYYVESDGKTKCSSGNTVTGYGASSLESVHPGMRRLEKCAVESCSDCKDNNMDCKGCPTGFYYKPSATAGRIDGCYDLSGTPSDPDGWGRRRNSLELFECNISPHVNDQTKKVCQFRVYIEIENLTSEKESGQGIAVLRFKMYGYQLDYDSKGVGAKDTIVDINDSDLAQFIQIHFKLRFQPETVTSEEFAKDMIRFQHLKESEKYKLIFELKDSELKNNYNGKTMISPYNSVLKFKEKESSQVLEFNLVGMKKSEEKTKDEKPNENDPNLGSNQPIGNPSGHPTNGQPGGQSQEQPSGLLPTDEAPGTQMSRGLINFTKYTTATTQGISFLAKILTIILLLSNFEITEIIFKIIQLITIFDKLRFMNVRIENSFGDFIHFIGELFEFNFIQRDDYHTASIVKYNKFETGKLSVIAYRKKPDQLILFSIAIILNLVASSMCRKIRQMNDNDFIGIEKKGNLVKKLKKVSSGIMMMTILDILFVTGHQLIPSEDYNHDDKSRVPHILQLLIHDVQLLLLANDEDDCSLYGP